MKVIPNGWEIRLLNELATEIGDGIHTTPKYKDNTIYYFINGNNLENGKIVVNEQSKTIDIQEYKKYKQKLNSNTILYSINGTIGNIANYCGEKIVLGKSAAYINANSEIINKYLFYILQSEYTKRFFDDELTGSTIKNLSLKSIRTLPVLIPMDTKEQIAISNVLSDIDVIISSITKLIDKKKNIKHGAMEELLTGKKRLNGFSIEWEKRKEDSICNVENIPEGYKKTEVGIIPEDWMPTTLESLCLPKGLVRGPFGGALKKEIFVKSGFKVYEQRNAIYKNPQIGNYYIDKDKYDELIRFKVIPGDFIVSCSGTIGRIYKIPENVERGIINQALLKIRIDEDKVNSSYFNLYFEWHKFQNRIIDTTQGGAMQNLVGMDVFKTTLIPLPPTIEEQTAIAQILSDMDTEIEKLNEKLNKYKDIKQGMMQELLTGKRRLIYND